MHSRASEPSGQDRALAGVGTQRPNLVGDPHLNPDRSRSDLIAKHFDATAFPVPALGAYGNAGRNLMIGPGKLECRFCPVQTVRSSRERQAEPPLGDVQCAQSRQSEQSPELISVADTGRSDSTSDARVMQFRFAPCILKNA